MTLFSYTRKLDERLSNILFTDNYPDIAPRELKEGVFSYFKNGGKRLRPALLCLCAGVFGGKVAEDSALKAALSVELFHTFTLIHDDIIDNDSLRRGVPTVHAAAEKSALQEGMIPEKTAQYGKSVAILAGDVLHALSVEQLASCPIPSHIALRLVRLLETGLIQPLISGEALDTKDSFISSGLESRKDEEKHILETIRLKTGVLLGYSALFGAMIGIGTDNEKDARAQKLYEFAELCGVAFQLKDDILGLAADEKKLGKPIGSDIREGKRTLLLLESYANSSAGERKFIDKVLGKKDANQDELEKARLILLKNGGVDYTEKLCEAYLFRAREILNGLPDNEYRNYLFELADYMTGRNY